MTETFPLLPLRDIVVFPGMVVPLFVGRDKSVAALEVAMEGSKDIFLLSQLDPGCDDPEGRDLYDTGVIAQVLQLLKLPDGTVRVLVEGQARAKLQKLETVGDHVAVEVVEIEEPTASGTEVSAMMRQVVEQFGEYAKLNKKIGDDAAEQLGEMDDAGELADTIAAAIQAKVTDKQALLVEPDPLKRLEMVMSFMEGELSVLQVERNIRGRVKRQMEKTQREYYLNEQLKAIQNELGDGDEDGGNEIAELTEKIAKTKLSKEASEKADSELKKLKAMQPMSAEATVIRNYLDVLLGLPWGKKSKVKKDIGKAQEILDADHYALEKVKDRIIEYLAVQARTNKLKGPILCLVGPPGVGKTSLGKSIAKATGPRVRAPVAGRRARRSGNPRPSAHLYRLAAGQDRHQPEEGGHEQSAVPARRDRQAGTGFPRRSGFGAARSARPRTEQQVPGSLSGTRPRPVGHHVRHHGEQPQPAAAAARPDGDHPAGRLYRGREGRDRGRVTCWPSRSRIMG